MLEVLIPNKLQLFLREGNSPESYAVEWLSQVPNRQGRNYFGTLPLHGKLLNILNAEFGQILNNEDLNNIKEMLGLEEDVDYAVQANLNRLRYGNIMILTDPDTDGKHILGLLLVFFLKRFPGLVYHGRIKFLRIPVLRIDEKGLKINFYTYASYNEWRQIQSSAGHNPDAYSPAYFKGLGTCDTKHIIEDFANPKIITLKVDETTGEKILMAFHKTKADERKIWLTNWFNRLQDVNLEGYNDLPISLFIDHELVEYSMESVERSIPAGIDDMKESQRKSFFAGLKNLGNAKKDKKMNVAQVGADAAKITNYKHGPKCLSDTITTMTFDFVGSNNMNLFVGRGQTGTRDRGGKDAAADRYIGVSLPWWIDLIYRKEDHGLLTKIIDEGQPREVEAYFPILNMVAVNGADGVGTGWSTKVPTHNPLDVAFWQQIRICKDLFPDRPTDLPMLRPYFKGFQGQIVEKPNGFRTEGHFYIDGQGRIVIDELPIGKWIRDYEKFLRKLEAENIFNRFEDFSDKKSPLFIIDGWSDGNPTLKKLGLISQHSYKNMTLLFKGPRGLYPKTYNNIQELMEDYYQLRLQKYIERKAFQLNQIEKIIHDLNERLRFINTINSGHLVITRRSKRAVLTDMGLMNFNPALYDSVKTSELSDENVAQIPLDIQKKQQEYDILNNTHPGQIWLNELEEFITKYCRNEKLNRSTYESTNPPVILNIEPKQ